MNVAVLQAFAASQKAENEAVEEMLKPSPREGIRRPPRGALILEKVAQALEELAENADRDMDDCMFDETATQYRDIIADIATCRKSLRSIEAHVRCQLAGEAEHYRTTLESIEALFLA